MSTQGRTSRRLRVGGDAALYLGVAVVAVGLLVGSRGVILAGAGGLAVAVVASLAARLCGASSEIDALLDDERGGGLS